MSSSSNPKSQPQIPNPKRMLRSNGVKVVPAYANRPDSTQLLRTFRLGFGIWELGFNGALDS